MASRWARLSRGSLVAVFAVLTAAVSHTVGGGVAPSRQVVALAIAFALVACVPLAGRQVSLPRTAAMIGISQLLLHGLFSLFGSAAAVSAVTDHHGAVVMTTGSAVPAHPHLAVLMLAAHSAAALATLLLVRRGEQAARSLVDLLSLVIARLARLLGTPLSVPTRRRPERFPAIRSGLRDVFLGAHADRGPPTAFGL